MDKGIKETAESVLREMPGVVGAFVQPDAFGHPREIHLLIKPGPRPREFAQHVKGVLESRLRVPIDQRIISIAQLADEKTDGAEAAPAPAADRPPPPRMDLPFTRVRLTAVESEVVASRVTVRVHLLHEGRTIQGLATEFEAGDGRARAAALATLQAVNQISGEQARFGLEFATVVEAVGERYALTSVVVTSPHLGRRSLSLAGAHSQDEDIQTASALAVLKASNRVLWFVMGRAERRLRFPRSR